MPHQGWVELAGTDGREVFTQVQSFLCHFADADGEALSADADVAEHGADADDDGGLCGNKPWIQI